MVVFLLILVILPTLLQIELEPVPRHGELPHHNLVALRRREDVIVLTLHLVELLLHLLEYHSLRIKHGLGHAHLLGDG